MLNETGINPLTLTWDAAAIMTRDDLFWDTVPNKPPIPLDLCVAVPISCLPMQSVLNVKALVGAVNQEKAIALEGAYSVIVKILPMVKWVSVIISPLVNL